MTLTFAKRLVAIEPIGENILAGQEIFLPPYPEICLFLIFFFGSGNIFWTIGSIVTKLSGNVKYIIIYALKLKNPDSTLPGAGGGAFLANFEYLKKKKFKIDQKCPTPCSR